jgi:serine/threonine protein kinase
VEGASVREQLAAHGPYSWAETKQILAQIAQGLADAHAAGVVHRDLKPSNVLIDPEGVAKLADLGIAKGRRFDPSNRHFDAPGNASLLGAGGPD